MPDRAVSHDVEQRRSFAAQQELLLAFHRVDDREGIVAVHALGVQLILRDPRAEPRRHSERHRLAERLSAHSVEVVRDVEEQWKPAAVPQLLYLIHRRHVKGLKHRAAPARAVADIRDDDAGLSVYPLEKRRSERHGSRSADDRVVRVYSERREENVHGAAQSALKAGVLREYLGENSVEQEVDRELLHAVVYHVSLDDLQHSAAAEILHCAVKLVFTELFNRSESFGEDVAVVAVRAEDEVPGVKRVSRSDRGRLLADREVSGSGVVVFDSVVDRVRLDLREHRLELAYHAHIAVNPQHVGFREELLLLLESLRVAVHRYILKADKAGAEDLFRVDELTPWHYLLTFLRKR